jgi:hypothetical protein
MMDSLNRQQTPSTALDLTISGKGNSPGTGKVPSKVSPNRVAYVLNQASNNRALPGATAAVSRGLALEADDRSLQSVGNYSVITEEGFPVSPTPGINAQAALAKTAPIGTTRMLLRHLCPHVWSCSRLDRFVDAICSVSANSRELD